MAEQIIMAATPDHQRPNDVLGEWNLIPEEDWNIHQRVAERTGGWLTAANAVSVIGAIATAKGLYHASQGEYGKAVAYGATGRVLDLVDGEVAERLGTRGKIGALVDAGLDKALTAGAMLTLARQKVISARFAAITLAQQTEIVIHNAAIEKAGANPNPSNDGKHSMFGIWLSAGLRIGQTLSEANYPKTASWFNRLASSAEITTAALGERAISGYVQQRASLSQATPSID